MKNKIPLALTLCSTMIALPLQANEGHQWRAIAFGQSTDSNFSSNVLPEKIGVNDVTIAGKKLTPQDSADLSQPITIESRGGKIANSHDRKMARVRRRRKARDCWSATSLATRANSLSRSATKSSRRHPIW